MNTDQALRVAKVYGDVTGVHTLYFDGGAHPVEAMPDRWVLNLTRDQAYEYAEVVESIFDLPRHTISGDMINAKATFAHVKLMIDEVVTKQRGVS